MKDRYMSIDATSPKTEKDLLEQVMNEALGFHQSGQQQEAEKRYRAILNVEPNDPKANHNLGVLYVQMGKAAASLKYFTTALDAEPAHGQYWLSYIDALFHAGQLETAQQVLALARQNGLQGDDVEALAIRLKVDVNCNSQKHSQHGGTPTQQEIDTLVALFTEGRSQEAISLAKTMTKRFPEHWVGWKMLGVLLSQLGQSAEALIPMKKALELKPDDAETHNNLGIIFQNLALLGEAEASYRRALKIDPNYFQALSNLGSTLQALGRLNDAETCYRKAIDLKSNYAKAHSNLGSLLQQIGRLDEAMVSYRQAIQLNPNVADWYYCLGNIFKAQGNLEKAEASYHCAIEIKPEFADAVFNLGYVLQEMGKIMEAGDYYRRTLELEPEYFGAHQNLGVIYQYMNGLVEAEESYKRAIQINPDRAEPHCSLGYILQELGRSDEAEISLRRAIEIKPDFATAYCNLGVILGDLGRLEEAEACYRQALHLKPNYVLAFSNLLFILNYSSRHTSTHYIAEAHQYGRQVAKNVTSRFTEWFCEKQPQRLRIGFVSGDFSNHPVGYFLENVLSHLDQSSVELIAYSTYQKMDDVTARLKPHFSAWHSIVGQSDESAARLIHNDGVNVLIDLSGHSRNNRLPVFAWKPAPVQVSWLGYFATTGVAEIDYFLGDPYVAPMSEANHFTEQIWQLPESYWCFTEPNATVEVGPLPALSAGRISFGCFNNLTKMNDDVVALWAKILLAVPESTLFLKSNQLQDALVRNTTIQRFVTHGIEANRLILEGTSSRAKYLDAYNRIDIALDPFPYPGGTTSIEGLWMGVPFITRRGDRFLSHAGETILHNAGLSDWIAVDADDYLAKAVGFAVNLEQLAKLRAELRQQVLASPLFDAGRFARHFEQALWKMWAKFIGN